MMGQTSVRILGVTALFAVVSLLIGEMDWDRGGERALLLLAVLGLIAGMGCFTRTPFLPDEDDRDPHRVRSIRRLLLGLALGLIVAHTVYFVAGAQNRRPPLLDIATTTMTAADLLTQGQSPYTRNVDPRPERVQVRGDLNGYKYLPVTPAVYLPLVKLFGPRGMIATNYLLFLVQIGLLFALALRIPSHNSPATGLAAVVLCMSVPFAPRELFRFGVIDLVSLDFGLAALWVSTAAQDQGRARRAFVAGALAGLSVSAKLMPGGALALVAVPSSSRVLYGLGLLAGGLVVVPFILDSPQAVWNNIIAFNAVRPTDSTAWHHGLAPEATIPAKVAAMVLIAGTAGTTLFGNPRPATRCLLGAAVIITLLLAAPINHRNYQLWWLPLMAIALAPGAVEGWRPGDRRRAEDERDKTAAQTGHP